MVSRTRLTLAFLFICFLAALTLLEISQANAQEITVCRDPDYDWVRFVFSGVPETVENGTLYWNGEGASFEGSTVLVDADANGYAFIQIVYEDGGYFDWHAGPDTPYCAEIVEDPVETIHLPSLEGNPHNCYMAYIQNEGGGESLVTDDAHPTGIVWRVADDGTIHLITGGGGQSNEPADYRLEAVACS